MGWDMCEYSLEINSRMRLCDLTESETSWPSLVWPGRPAAGVATLLKPPPGTIDQFEYAKALG